MKSYLQSAHKQFTYYKSLGEKALAQMDDAYLFSSPSSQENTPAVIVKHIIGNMKSRWTDIFNTDGEKEWRHRDNEFVNDIRNRSDLMELWESGWQVLFATLDALDKNDLEKIIYIRKMGHTVCEAINRQLCHYAYHIGQLVLLGKQCQGENWQSLSIPLGNSKVYNQDKMSKEKRRAHFTDDL